jgi:mRNA interferase MazF
MTSDLVDAPDFRITIDPSDKNGLRTPSQVMSDKSTTVRRERIGGVIGHLEPGDLRRLNVALALVMGLAD